MNVIGLGLGQSASRFLGLGFSPGAAAPGASAAEIWSYTLSNGLTAGQNVVAIHAMLTQLTGGSVILPVNVKQMNDAVVIGDGTEANMWRGFGVPP